MYVVYMLVFYLLLLAAMICLHVFIANRFCEVAAMKGHRERKYFWYCFWLGWIGYLLVIALPDRKGAATMAYELPEL